MSRIFYIVLIFLSACAPQFNSEPSEIHYKITPQANGFLVEITHDASVAPTMTSPAYYSTFSLQSSGNDHTVRYFIKPARRQAHGPSDTQIDLSEGFFKTSGYGLIACLGRKWDEAKSVRITWQAPKPWRFANSFSAGATQQSFKASCYQLQNALYAGGTNLRFYETPLATVAISNNASEKVNKKLIATVKKNMVKVKDFWGELDDAKEYYFVLIHPANGNEHGGTAQFQSFQLALADFTPSDASKELDHLIAHEYFHQWNGIKINVPVSTQHEVRWFVEGFTDYFAFSISGHTANFSNRFENVSLKNYVSDMKTHFDVPYIQGRKIAADMDKAIQNYSSRKLEHLMRHIVRRSQADPLFYLTQASILGVICEGNYMNCDQAHQLIENHVNLGHPFVTASRD
ncbi:MAG: M1 family aminopeptidase [Myxococcota bacterium]